MEHAVVQTDVDRYIIVEYLAEGGMGAIFLGKKVGMGGFEKEVVLKQLLPEFTSQPEFIDLFLREAKLSAALDHANIVHTIDLVAAGSDYFIVMEYVRGGDLRSILRRIKQHGHRLEPAAAIFVAREILSALAYAHEKKSTDGKPLKLIHRDVSPSNIMVSAAGEVKLADFGIAKASTHKSVFYRVKGKVGYMSPEQAYGDPLDSRSDLYSLAVCLHEMFSGERLFVADLLSTPDQIYGQRIPKIEGLAGMPQGMDRVMSRALAFDPGGRYQTALEFQDALVQAAFEAAMLFAAPDLASHLLEVCGPDPSQWNKEIEEGEGQEEGRPGTQVLGSEDHSDRSDRQFSGVELTSVFTGLPEILGPEPRSDDPSKPRARVRDQRRRGAAAAELSPPPASDSEATRHVKIDPRGLAYEATRLQVDPVSGGKKAQRLTAPGFDFSDLEESEPVAPAPAPRPPQQPAWLATPWADDSGPSLEEEPTMTVQDGLPEPPELAASGLPVEPPPFEDSDERRPSAVPDGATREVRLRREKVGPGTSIPAPVRLDLSSPSLEERGRRRPEQHLMTAKVRAAQEPQRHRRTMLIASAALLVAGGTIAAIVGLTGPSLEDPGTAAHAPPKKRAAPGDSGPLSSGLATPDLLPPDRYVTPAAPDLGHDRGGGAGVEPSGGRSGVLKVDSTPATAAVFLNGVHQCATPCTVEELEESRVYTLSVRRKNYVSWSSLIDMSKRRRVAINALLSEEPDSQRVGYLLVRSTPVADVHVDGKEIGRVSSEGRIPLPPGPYEISLSHPRRERRPRFLLTIVPRQTVVITPRF